MLREASLNRHYRGGELVGLVTLGLCLDVVIYLSHRVVLPISCLLQPTLQLGFATQHRDYKCNCEVVKINIVAVHAELHPLENFSYAECAAGAVAGNTTYNLVGTVLYTTIPLVFSIKGYTWMLKKVLRNAWQYAWRRLIG